jgi:hypothetical protein
MSYIKRFIGGGIIIFIAMMAGFFFLLRGCLSQYDERAALLPVLYFEKDTSRIIFSLVSYGKATSYSSGRGFTHKTLSTSYFIQQNDAVTGAKKKEKKIRHHDDIKNYPIETMGAAHGRAWIFMGELMAFDPFTLEQVADIETLESKNSDLTGKFPAERRYYRFNDRDQNIYFTASDGSKWMLNTLTLHVMAAAENPDKSGAEAELKEIEKLYALLNRTLDSLSKAYLREPSRKYSAGEISLSNLQAMHASYRIKQTDLYKYRDSLQAWRSAVENRVREETKLKSALESLRRLDGGFSQMAVNQDTAGNTWFGLFSEPEFEKLYERVDIQRAYDETARRSLIRTTATRDRYGNLMFNKEQAQLVSANKYFLQGGFLLNKLTASPIHLENSNDYLVVYKDKIGNDGKIQLARVNEKGEAVWSIDSELKTWADWILTKDRLFIFGANNQELSSGQYNVLLIADLTTGKTVLYDYAADR